MRSAGVTFNTLPGKGNGMSSGGQKIGSRENTQAQAQVASRMIGRSEFVRLVVATPLMCQSRDMSMCSVVQDFSARQKPVLLCAAIFGHYCAAPVCSLKCSTPPSQVHLFSSPRAENFPHELQGREPWMSRASDRGNRGASAREIMRPSDEVESSPGERKMKSDPREESGPREKEI